MTMLESIIGIIGVLAGTVVQARLQQRAQRVEREEVRAGAHRVDRIGAVQALAVALADHRRTMIRRKELFLGDADDAEMAAARDQTHATRAALTAPHVQVQLLVPELAEAADNAVTAAYGIRAAGNALALDAARSVAVGAAEHFLVCAAGILRQPSASRR
jgi:hypothetical protein